MVRLFFALLALCLAASLAGPARAQMLEQDVERAGATYKQTAMGMAGPHACWQMCANDRNCKAWTWQRPGILGPQGVCQLKTAVMPGQDSPCCVSGLSNKLEQKIEAAFARPRATMMTPAPMRPVMSPGDPVRNYPVIAPHRPVMARPAPPVMPARPVYSPAMRANPAAPMAPAPAAPAYNSSRILGEAPVKPVPVVGPRRDADGVPIYSVNRDFKAAPSKVGNVQEVQPVQPVQQANAKLPAGALQLLGD